MFKQVEGTDLKINTSGKMINIKTGYEYKSHVSKDGYLVFGNVKQLYRKSRMVHKLVYFTFNDIDFYSEFNNPIRFQIDHIDRNKKNCNLSNLRLITVNANSLNKQTYSIKICYNKSGKCIITDNIMEFSRLYKLDNGALYKIIKNGKLSYKGWKIRIIDVSNEQKEIDFIKEVDINTCADNIKQAIADMKKSFDRVKEHRAYSNNTIVATNKKLKIEEVFLYNDRASFCEKYGLEKRRIAEVLKGLRKTHKGFEFKIDNAVGEQQLQKNNRE